MATVGTCETTTCIFNQQMQCNAASIKVVGEDPRCGTFQRREGPTEGRTLGQTTEPIVER